MKRILAFLLALLARMACGQAVEIDYVEWNDNKLIIHYKLEDANATHQYLVNLFTSHDNFTTALTKVTGDVGTEVKPGLNKTITWDINRELPNFKGTLVFEVRGRVYIPYVKLRDFGENRVFKRGSNIPLTWVSGNATGQVNIELFRGQERIPVENNIVNSGRYDWHIPSGLKKGSNYKLRFTNTRDRTDFVESPQFTIKPKIPGLIKIAGVLALGGGLAFIAGSGEGGGSGSLTDEPLPGNPGKPN